MKKNQLGYSEGSIKKTNIKLDDKRKNLNFGCVRFRKNILKFLNNKILERWLSG